MSGSIEGLPLPDEVALQCLARVPFYLLPKLEVVCRSWRAAVRSPEFFKTRDEVGSSENLICMSAFDGQNIWQICDPPRNIWMTFPLPSMVRSISKFGTVSIGGKLFVLGGIDYARHVTTNEVWSYDLVTRQWIPRASMLLPRFKFGCCVLDGKIIVAGGFMGEWKITSKAERYDPDKDEWIPIPDLLKTHNRKCTAVVIGGNVHVSYKGFSIVQVLDDVEVVWRVVDYGYELESIERPIAVVHDTIYAMSRDEFICKVERDSESERYIVNFSGRLSSIGHSCQMIGLGDSIYVIRWSSYSRMDMFVLKIRGREVLWPWGRRELTSGCWGRIRWSTGLRF